MYAGILSILTVIAMILVMGTGVHYAIVVSDKMRNPKPTHDKRLTKILLRLEIFLYAMFIFGVSFSTIT